MSSHLGRGQCTVVQGGAGSIIVLSMHGFESILLVPGICNGTHLTEDIFCCEVPSTSGHGSDQHLHHWLTMTRAASVGVSTRWFMLACGSRECPPRASQRMNLSPRKVRTKVGQIQECQAAGISPWKMSLRVKTCLQ